MEKTRRTRVEMEDLNALLITLVTQNAPATVRQVFYLASTALTKTERVYKRVCERLKTLRLEGRVRWNQITDMTRWQRKPLTFNNLESAVEHTRLTYRRAVWQGLNCRVFIVLEKDTLAGVVGQVTDEYDVPLLVTRGFSSLTFQRGVADDINSYSQARITSYVYALGDWDPSGLKAHASFKKRLEDWCQQDNEEFYGAACKTLWGAGSILDSPVSILLSWTADCAFWGEKTAAASPEAWKDGHRRVCTGTGG